MLALRVVKFQPGANARGRGLDNFIHSSQIPRFSDTDSTPSVPVTECIIEVNRKQNLLVHLSLAQGVVTSISNIWLNKRGAMSFIDVYFAQLVRQFSQEVS